MGLSRHFSRIPGHSQFGTWHLLHTGVPPGPTKALVFSLPRLLGSPPIQCMSQIRASLVLSEAVAARKLNLYPGASLRWALHLLQKYHLPGMPKANSSKQTELKSPLDLPHFQLPYSKYPLAGLQTPIQGFPSLSIQKLYPACPKELLPLL